MVTAKGVKPMTHYAPPCTDCDGFGWSGIERGGTVIPVSCVCYDCSVKDTGERGHTVYYKRIGEEKFDMPPLAECCKDGCCTDEEWVK